jgi:hypothetical protein
MILGYMRVKAGRLRLAFLLRRRRKFLVSFAGGLFRSVGILIKVLGEVLITADYPKF